MEKQKRRPYLMTWVTALAIVVVALAAAMVIRGVMAADDGTDIGSEKAKSIALSDADLSADEVTFTKSSLQTEDGKNIYEVDFYTDEKEYDYEIDAATGAVVAKDEDQIKTKQRKSARSNSNAADLVKTKKDKDASTYIGVSKAKRIALSNAGVSAASAYFEEAQLSHDDGYPIYDIEFRADGVKYDYEINAVNGIILEKSIERKTVKSNDGSGNYHDDDDYDDDFDDDYDDDHDDDDHDDDHDDD